MRGGNIFKRVRLFAIFSGVALATVGLAVPAIKSWYGFASIETQSRSYKANTSKRLAEADAERNKRICPEYQKAVAENDEGKINAMIGYKHCADWKPE